MTRNLFFHELREKKRGGISGNIRRDTVRIDLVTHALLFFVFRRTPNTAKYSAFSRT